MLRDDVGDQDKNLAAGLDVDAAAVARCGGGAGVVTGGGGGELAATVANEGDRGFDPDWQVAGPGMVAGGEGGGVGGSVRGVVGAAFFAEWVKFVGHGVSRAGGTADDPRFAVPVV